ncbi:uncharacterized protein LOC117168253 isoform X2 [Belonocnema kinseyi]|uniref:uncharacterized protein LOC117168253 isoform X2 n=1 Tax=Belonocnema kinseyi TaxID=2817044 RepID=UPI00143DE832|nr:uncharacterized protein LOC117168253 isoform X2 [Belonocnema kinseyi]
MYCAEQHTVHFRDFEVFDVKSNPYVNINHAKERPDSSGKTDINWKTHISRTSHPLKVNYTVYYPQLEKNRSEKVDNLCGVYQEGTTEGNMQKFLLKVLANIEKCPIQKGTTYSIPEKFSMFFNSDQKFCGEIEVKFNIFTEADSDLIISGGSKGTITGC